MPVYPRRAAAFQALPWPTTSARGRRWTLCWTLQSAASATLVKPAQDTFWGGYSGYFADPEGYLWEIAWNPHFPIE